MAELDATNITLIERVKNRLDQDSWEEFTTTYEPYIQAILRRSGLANQQVDDVTQDILLSLWKGMDNFEYDPDQCKFRTWLFTVCKNKLFTHFKANQKNKANVSLQVDQDLATESELDGMIEKEWQIYIGKKAFEKVKILFKPHIIESYLAFQNGDTPLDISKKHKIAENTVYVYNKRVKEAMSREIILLIHELE